MKGRLTQKVGFLGAGVGLTLFALFGLMPGSFIGGVLGLNITGMIFGTPVSPGVVPRIIIALGMITGVLISGLIFVVAGAVVGTSIGYILDALLGRTKEEAGKIENLRGKEV